MNSRQYTPVDHLLMHIDRSLNTVFGRPPSDRESPAQGVEETELSPAERRVSAGLMRVNHAGEISAQALYQGQAVTARTSAVRDTMEEAAQEENDHLAWCENRLEELGDHTSYLGPFWYAGSFMIGALAGVAGDRWSLGFVAETERQVIRHLDGHLQTLPEHDLRSRAIVEQMKVDEARHATTAIESGGVELPAPVKSLMTLTSRVMTKAAYWI